MDPSPTSADPGGWWHAARRALRGRRGGAAAVFAVSGSILLGMAGLATEGTLLLLTRRDAQHGADLAALAAASAYQFRGRTAALAAGTETGVRNGFAASAVAVRNPPGSGSQAGNANAFEVQITGRVPIVLGRAFVNQAYGNVSERAVALLYGTTPACLLALTGGVTIQNSAAFTAQGCAVGSNAPGVSVTIPQSNVLVAARSVIAFGTCSGCNNSRWSLTEGYQEHAPPLSNPYEALDSKPQTQSCINSAALSVRGAIAPTGVSKAYCYGVEISNTAAVVMLPGTYVFKNAPFTVGSILSFSCVGCTFIFTGSNPGNFSLSNTSIAILSAPVTNNDDSDYDGLLIYRSRGGAVGNSGTPNINMQSVLAFSITGGIYAPDSYVRMSNVASNAVTSCLALVGGTLEIGNLASFSFNASGCASLRTPVPTARVVRLVE